MKKHLQIERVYIGIAYSRVDNDEFIKLNFKAFRQNSEDMVQEIKENSVMSMVGRFLNVESELYVRIFLFYQHCNACVCVLNDEKLKTYVE